MASLLHSEANHVAILEPAAGAGALIAAAVEHLCLRPDRPAELHIEAHEIDPRLIVDLRHTLRRCASHAAEAGVRFTSELVEGDFLESAAASAEADLFAVIAPARFDAVIMNPPYRKIRSDSNHREWTRRFGLETTNLYSAFVAAAILALRDGGELVAITPRSFCNGVYFKPFRRFLLERTSFSHLLLFESRREAFSDDDVLQENIIFRVVRNAPRNGVAISSIDGIEHAPSTRTIPHEQLVRPADPDSFIHLSTAGEEHRLAAGSGSMLRSTIASLGISVSTGRVVDFRARTSLRAQPAPDTAPLLYPVHLRPNGIEWPIDGKKPNAIAVNDGTRALLVRNDHYVLAKRFTSKEQKRRVVAAVIEPEALPGDLLGIENHLNYFHRNGRGVDAEIALGLAIFLNSTVVDLLFRRFSGHTQVNAADLRALPYPTERQLRRLARSSVQPHHPQVAVDRVIDEVILTDE